MCNSHDASFQESSTHGGECASWHQFQRRRFLKQATMAGGLLSSGLLTHFAEALAVQEERTRLVRNRRSQPKSLILVWLQGGPSQLETFDPHPGTIIGGETKGISSSVSGLTIAETLPRSAEIMHHGTLIRSMVSKEGDHERATYNMKTGWRPDPTLVHPSIGSVICHQTDGNIEIPRHISILSGQWPSRGGYLGSELDAFKTGDPRDPLPNLKSYIEPEIMKDRIQDLNEVVEKEFRRGRRRDIDQNKTLHATSTRRALQMMDSQQIKAFDVSVESESTRAAFGDTAFGRGCLAAVRLIEQGVRCVEIELTGWDTHASNFTLQSLLCKSLDSGLHGLVQLLVERDLLDETVVMCGGEFGRTPSINVADGRDHWPTGFSTLLLGGPFRRGHVHGETTKDALAKDADPLTGVSDPVTIENLHATMLHSFGIDYSKELQTPVGRPLALSKGAVVESLLDKA